MLLQVIIVFFLGLLYDVFSSLYLRAVNAKKPGLAALMSGILTTFGYYVWYVTQGSDQVILTVIAYAAGGAIGTYLGLVVHEAQRDVCKTK